MQWFAEYNTSTGALYSHGNGDGTHNPQASNSVKTWPSAQRGIWNTSTLEYDPDTTSPVILNNRDFLLLFTTAERIAIQSSIDLGVKDFLFLLSAEATVNLRSPTTMAGLDYLVALGLLVDDARKNEILTAGGA